jgi:hypothetical protein
MNIGKNTCEYFEKKSLFLTIILKKTSKNSPLVISGMLFLKKFNKLNRSVFFY